MKRSLLFSLILGASLASAQYYKTETIPLPEEGGVGLVSITLMPDQKVAITDLQGRVWMGTGLYEDDLGEVTWSRFSPAANQSLEALGAAFTSDPDAHGDTWALIDSTKTESDRNGWAIRIDQGGKRHPEVSGIRSPGGIGFNVVGDLFYTDNQGPWNGSSSLKWLKPGGFMGDPSGNATAKKMGLPMPPSPESGSRIQIEREKDPRLVPPAVVFPHAKVGQSPTAIVPDVTGRKFGPFEKQLLVGEQIDSEVQRVDLEMVNGFYQGAVFRFLDGFSSSVVGMRLAEDGSLFVAGSQKGASSADGKSFSLERTRWTGEIPFEIKTMRVTPSGFKLTFTKPVDEASASDPANYKMAAWTYLYQKSHGSPEVDQATPKVTAAKVSEDKLVVEITVIGWVQGHVHHLDAKALKSAEGKALWHSDAYYTLNEIPFATSSETKEE